MFLRSAFTHFATVKDAQVAPEISRSSIWLTPYNRMAFRPCVFSDPFANETHFAQQTLCIDSIQRVQLCRYRPFLCDFICELRWLTSVNRRAQSVQWYNSFESALIPINFPLAWIFKCSSGIEVTFCNVCISIADHRQDSRTIVKSWIILTLQSIYVLYGIEHAER